MYTYIYIANVKMYSNMNDFIPITCVGLEASKFMVNINF